MRISQNFIKIITLSSLISSASSGHAKEQIIRDPLNPYSMNDKISYLISNKIIQSCRLNSVTIACYYELGPAVDPFTEMDRDTIDEAKFLSLQLGAVASDYVISRSSDALSSAISSRFNLGEMKSRNAFAEEMINERSEDQGKTIDWKAKWTERTVGSMPQMLMETGFQFVTSELFSYGVNKIQPAATQFYVQFDGETYQVNGVDTEHAQLVYKARKKYGEFDPEDELTKKILQAENIKIRIGAEAVLHQSKLSKAAGILVEKSLSLGLTFLNVYINRSINTIVDTRIANHTTFDEKGPVKGSGDYGWIKSTGIGMGQHVIIPAVTESIRAKIIGGYYHMFPKYPLNTPESQKKLLGVGNSCGKYHFIYLQDETGES